MVRCFACGKIILNVNEPCPNCGYIFDVDTELGCPNKEDGACNLTGMFCEVPDDEFGACEIKSKAEKESWY